METPFETGPERYQPPTDYTYAHDPKLRFDQRRLASVVGIIALGMPVVLGIGGWWLGRFRTALSEYYYEIFGLGDAFVGSLVAIGALLMAYRGWTPKVAQLASLAGIASFFVAFVPMNGWVTGCETVDAAGACTKEAFIYPDAGYWIHAASAGVLFAILAFFCLFVFTKLPPGRPGDPPGPTLAKRRRNRIYIASGIIIALSAIAIAIGDLLVGVWWRDYQLTFWFEALILGAFGISWLTQGRALSQLSDPRDRDDAAAAGRSKAFLFSGRDKPC